MVKAEHCRAQVLPPPVHHRAGCVLVMMFTAAVETLTKAQGQRERGGEGCFSRQLDTAYSHKGAMPGSPFVPLSISPFPYEPFQESQLLSVVM